MTASSGKVTKEKLASPNSSQLPGTLSRFLRFYSTTGDYILGVHLFVKPDGSIGGSGRPDPKFILFNGVEYFC